MFIFSALTVAGTAGAQVPPPPSLPGQDQLAERLMASLREKNLGAYRSLLADDVEVFEDGQIIASNKKEGLSKFGVKITTPGVVFSIDRGYSSTGRIMLVEYFNSSGSWGDGPPKHCCWSYDAVAYDIRGSKITRISRLSGGDKKLSP